MGAQRLGAVGGVRVGQRGRERGAQALGVGGVAVAREIAEIFALRGTLREHQRHARRRRLERRERSALGPARQHEGAGACQRRAQHLAAGLEPPRADQPLPELGADPRGIAGIAVMADQHQIERQVPQRPREAELVLARLDAADADHVIAGARGQVGLPEKRRIAARPERRIDRVVDQAGAFGRHLRADCRQRRALGLAEEDHVIAKRQHLADHGVIARGDLVVLAAGLQLAAQRGAGLRRQIRLLQGLPERHLAEIEVDRREDHPLARGPEIAQRRQRALGRPDVEEMHGLLGDLRGAFVEPGLCGPADPPQRLGAARHPHAGAAERAVLAAMQQQAHGGGGGGGFGHASLGRLFGRGMCQGSRRARAQRQAQGAGRRLWRGCRGTQGWRRGSGKAGAGRIARRKASGAAPLGGGAGRDGSIS